MLRQPTILEHSNRLTFVCLPSRLSLRIDTKLKAREMEITVLKLNQLLVAREHYNSMKQFGQWLKMKYFNFPSFLPEPLNWSWIIAIKKWMGSFPWFSLALLLHFVFIRKKWPTSGEKWAGISVMQTGRNSTAWQIEPRRLLKSVNQLKFNPSPCLWYENITMAINETVYGCASASEEVQKWNQINWTLALKDVVNFVDLVFIWCLCFFIDVVAVAERRRIIRNWRWVFGFITHTHTIDEYTTFRFVSFCWLVFTIHIMKPHQHYCYTNVNALTVCLSLPYWISTDCKPEKSLHMWHAAHQERLHCTLYPSACVTSGVTFDSRLPRLLATAVEYLKLLLGPTVARKSLCVSVNECNTPHNGKCQSIKIHECVNAFDMVSVCNMPAVMIVQ